MTVLSHSEWPRPAQIGFDVPLDAVNAKLHPFQRAAVQWAVKMGKAALFEDCGLGKSPQQLAWADVVARWEQPGTYDFVDYAGELDVLTNGDDFAFDIPLDYESMHVEPPAAEAVP